MEGKPVDRGGRAGEEPRQNKSTSLSSGRRHSLLQSLELEDSGNEVEDAAEVPGTSSSSNSSPSAASTVTSEGNQGHGKSSVEEMEVTSMVLGGCTRCHIYVMLHREKLRCPRCYSSAVVNFFHG